jgi:hypothetical protein
MPNKKDQDKTSAQHKDGHTSKEKKEEKSHREPHVGKHERKQAESKPG